VAAEVEHHHAAGAGETGRHPAHVRPVDRHREAVREHEGEVPQPIVTVATIGCDVRPDQPHSVRCSYLDRFHSGYPLDRADDVSVRTTTRRVETSVDLLLMTAASQPTAEVMPALGLLAHSVRVVSPEVSVLIDTPPGDIVLVDARHTLAEARGLCRLLQTTGVPVPVLAVLTEGGLAAVAADWGVDDVLLDTAGPAEVEARLRLSVTRRAAASAPGEGGVIRAGDLAIDETTYTCRLRGRPLDLTYKEFELLKFLAQHPGRVFSRAQLLQEVWGYDYYGGTRTVDVHVRRLRAKLGAEHEQLIGTVRNVGYKFVRQPPAQVTAEAPATVG
jgi:DNA-binding response OmpR family regulator